MAYRSSCYTHSPHLNIPRSFQIVIYLILEHIYTSSINTFPWQSIPLIYRSLRKCRLSDTSNLHCSLANAQLCPRVLLYQVLYLKNMPPSKLSIPCVILKTCIWSPRTRLTSGWILRSWTLPSKHEAIESVHVNIIMCKVLHDYAANVVSDILTEVARRSK